MAKNSAWDAPVLPRGRVATWTREQLDKLSSDDLRSLRANAEGRKETEVAALCSEILEGRSAPKGRARKSA